MSDQPSGKSRKGRPLKEAVDRRTQRVTIWLTVSEHADLTGRAGKGKISEFCRAAVLSQTLPRPIPAINLQAWGQLGKSLGGLTTLINFCKIDAAGFELIDGLRREVKLLRWRLLSGEDRQQ